MPRSVGVVLIYERTANVARMKPAEYGMFGVKMPRITFRDSANPCIAYGLHGLLW